MNIIDKNYFIMQKSKVGIEPGTFGIEGDYACTALR